MKLFNGTCMNNKTNKKMTKHDIRINTFLGLLNSHKVLSISEVAELLNVSSMTVRRDYKELNEKGLVSLKNGVLFLSDNEDIMPIKKIYNLQKETMVQSYMKNAIGKYAASLIEDNDTVIIDTGTTTEALATFFPEDKNLNVFCSNLNILNLMVTNENINIMFSGGNYHSNTEMFESQQSIEFISSFRANKAFISAAGVHDKLGLTCMNNYEVKTKQAIIKSADKHILLVDSSKFGKVHSSYFSDLSSIDIIITDKNISDKWKKIIEDAGIELICAK